MLVAGFADPVLAAQSTFRAVLDAMARPGSLQPITAPLTPPHPLCAGAAAIALTLCDHDTPVWLDAELRASESIVEWLRFHCGCELVADSRRAAFAFALDATTLPPFDAFNPGTDDYPDRSTTLVLQVDTLRAGPSLMLTGPGIRDRAHLRATPVPHDLVARLAENRSRFPRGIDLVLAAADAVAALPRSIRVAEEA